MSAPIIWVILPGLAAFLLYILRRFKNMIFIAEFTLCMVLALLAWLLPINEPIALGIPNMPAMQLVDTIQIYGRKLVIGNTEKPILILIYLGLSLWSGGALIARVQRLFAPLSLGVAATITAALMIEPTLYATLLIVVAALLCIPILTPPGQLIRNGVTRFLAFQIMGMCLILLADWMINILLNNPDNNPLMAPTTLLFGLGFAMAGGILPFHTWIPMLTEESHPYAASFVFFMMPVGVSFIGIKYLHIVAGLEIFPTVQIVMQYAGVIMILIGGIWAAFENHLARIMGFAVIMQIGTGLLAISLGTQASQTSPLRSLFFAQLIPHGIALAVWALALSCIYSALPRSGSNTNPVMRFRVVQGFSHRMPIAALAIILATFSLAGLPMLASFPSQIALWASLSQNSLPITLLALAGNSSLFIAGLRSMAVLVTRPPADSDLEEPATRVKWSINEPFILAMLLALGILMLFIIGITPQWFLPLISEQPAFIIQTP